MNILCESVQRMPFSFECLQFVLQDHNYGAPPPQTPPHLTAVLNFNRPAIEDPESLLLDGQQSHIINKVQSKQSIEDDATSVISSETGREQELEGEETETAPEGEGEGDEDSITRCICEFQHDDGYMICCDRCLVWQHVDCMGIDRNNIPDEYLCELCHPRRIDKTRARALQIRKREELFNSDSSSESSISSADVNDLVRATFKNRRSKRQFTPSKRKVESSESLGLNNNNFHSKVTKLKKNIQQLRGNDMKNKKEIASTTSPHLQLIKRQKRQGAKKIERLTRLKEKEEKKKLDSFNVTPLRRWIERYEEAVTNHYSPELRSRIPYLKVNSQWDDSKKNSIDTGKYRLNILNNDLKCLVATSSFPANTTVMELRGKYMLSSQNKSNFQILDGEKKSVPFVFLYEISQDGTKVCVDARTYGNDARFIRRSCKPNAEIKHCIERGTLHLYIVTSIAIEKNIEITIPHDELSHFLLSSANHSTCPILCACNDPINCKFQYVSFASISSKDNYSADIKNIDSKEKRRQSKKKKVINENYNETLNQHQIPASEKVFMGTPALVQSNSKKTLTPDNFLTNSNNKNSLQRNHEILSSTVSITGMADKKKTEHILNKKQSIVDNPNEQVSRILPTERPERIYKDSMKEKKKLTREERKMEAIMKAFERLEKAELKKQELQARNAQRKELTITQSDDDHSTLMIPEKSISVIKDKVFTRRKKRKGRTRSISSMHQSQFNSAESDFTSGDEIHFLQSSSAPRMSEKKIQEIQDTKSENSTSLAQVLSNSSITDLRSPIHAASRSTPIKSPSADSNSSQGSMPSTPLSSACLLVAAAVGPLAPGFKFPKTKKHLMNEWLREAPEQTIEISTSRKMQVQNEQAVAGSCDSSPQRILCKISGSAKKRWLRQAISEECDSPGSPGRPESPPSEMLAPPKKRRIARESLSSDNCTPPTTPTMLHSENLITSTERLFLNEEDYIDQMLSSSTNGFETINTLNKLNSEEDRCEPPFSNEKNAFISSDATPEFNSSILVVNEENFSDAHNPEKFTNITKNKKTVNLKYQMIERESIKPENSKKNDVPDRLSQKYTQQTDTNIKKNEFKIDLNINDCNSAVRKNPKKDEKCYEKKENVETSEHDLKKIDRRVCVDEFDVEAQMKKITGDDGEDVIDKLKTDINLKNDKNIDCLEGFFENSKESSEDKEYEQPADLFNLSKSEDSNTRVSSCCNEKDTNVCQKSTKILFSKDDLLDEKLFYEKQDSKILLCETKSSEYFDLSTESSEKIYNSTKKKSLVNLDQQNSSSKNISYPQYECLTSIPPLSERIRKKTDFSTVLKSKMEIEASILESSLNFEMVRNNDTCEESKRIPLVLKDSAKTEISNDAESNFQVSNESESAKKSRSTFKLDEVNRKFTNTKLNHQTEIPQTDRVSQSCNYKNNSIDIKNKLGCLPRDPEKLKDPRTVVPNKLVQSKLLQNSFPVKRKLSINEYRKRKQISKAATELKNNLVSSEEKSLVQEISDSASTGTSSLSSDDEIIPKTTSESSNIAVMSPFKSIGRDEKKGGDEGMIGWSASPTLVERQRENLTERLKREFGLFLNDEDDEESIYKQGTKSMLDDRSVCLENSIRTNMSENSHSQLSSQPCTGSVTCVLSSCAHKSAHSSTLQLIDHSNLITLKTLDNPCPLTYQSTTTMTTKQQLISQAPPGSNPYPPVQVIESSESFTQNLQLEQTLNVFPPLEISTLTISQLKPEESQSLYQSANLVPQSLCSNDKSTCHNQSLPKS